MALIYFLQRPFLALIDIFGSSKRIKNFIKPNLKTHLTKGKHDRWELPCGHLELAVFV